MCTYVTTDLRLVASGKAPQGSWTQLRAATVYYDHPVHAPAEHTLNIDLTPEGATPSDRFAFELAEDSARALVAAIIAVLPPAGQPRPT